MITNLRPRPRRAYSELLGETMSGPILRRRRKRRAEKRELAAQIEAETSELIKSATEGYNVGDVVYGADVSTGTHTGNPHLAQQSSGGLPLMPLLIVGGIGALLFVVMK